MGLSKSKTKSDPWKPAQPYILANLEQQKQVFDSTQPELENFAKMQRETYGRVAPGAEAGIVGAQGLVNDTIGGKFLDANPYVDGMIEQGDREITDQVNGQFNSRFGSGYHAKALGRELADNRTRLRFGNYENERSNQMEAAGSLGNLAGQATALPQLASGTYADAIGGLFGQYNKTKTSTPWGPALINGASNAAAAYFGGKK